MEVIRVSVTDGGGAVLFVPRRHPRYLSEAPEPLLLKPAQVIGGQRSCLLCHKPELPPQLLPVKYRSRQYLRLLRRL